ncbi:hypothetical protein IWW42_004776 [Coemansia sp. RSA 1085]|nr:hypothetical protein IWW42_004776 [Coemansia sp. RSA 1085]
MGNVATKDISDAQRGRESSFVVYGVISKGPLGQTQIVEHTATRRRYALQQISKRICVEQKQARKILRERELLEQVDHPYILNLRFSFQNAHTLFMATELQSGGTLRRQLKGRRVGEAVARVWAAELSSALQHLHFEQGIVHGQVGIDSVMVDMGGHVVLGGFADASRGADAACGYADDWQGVGLVAHWALFGKAPVWTSAGDVVFPVATDVRVTMDCMSAVRGLLHQDPARRLGAGPSGFDHLRQHPFFAALDWPALEARALPPPYICTDIYRHLVDDSHEQQQLAAAEMPVPSKELELLEKEFLEFDYGEFQRFRAYMARYGGISEAAADAVRALPVPVNPLDMSYAIAPGDIPLEYLTLGGWPIVAPLLSNASEKSSASSVSGDALAASNDTESLASESLVSALGLRYAGDKEPEKEQRPASRALKQGGLLVRRTTTNALARLGSSRGKKMLRSHKKAGKQFTVKKKDPAKEDLGEKAAKEDPGANAAKGDPGANAAKEDPGANAAKEPKEPPLIQPPGFVPIDPVTWTQLRPQQRELAERYCTKAIHETQRLMMAIQTQDDSGSENELFQSTYSLTASSLLPAARREAHSGAPRYQHPKPAQRADRKLRAAATLSVASSSQLTLLLSQNHCHQLPNPMQSRMACKSTPDLDAHFAYQADQQAYKSSEKSLLTHHRGPSTPALSSTRPLTRRLHAGSTASAMAVPRLQPIAAAWPPAAHLRGDTGQTSQVLARPMRSPSTPISPMSDSEWDMLPEAADRIGLSSAAAAVAAATAATASASCILSKKRSF